MSALDLSRLTPIDAVAALRSYPRRYRAAVQPIEDPELDEQARRPGPGGRSALDVVVEVTRMWKVLADGLHQIVVTDTPVLPPAVVDPAERHWDTPAPTSLSEALLTQEEVAAALVEQVDHVPANAWNRTGTVVGGATVSAFDVVKEAVAVGHAGLDEVGTILAAVRG